MKKIIAAILAAGFVSSVSAAPVNPSALTADTLGCSSISGSSITLTECAANSAVSTFAEAGTATLTFTSSGTAAEFYATISNESFSLFQFFSGAPGGAGSVSMSIAGPDSLLFQFNVPIGTATFSDIDWSFAPAGGGAGGAGEVAADVPAPGTIALLGLGLVGFGVRGLRNKK
jgi:hypothetical protein